MRRCPTCKEDKSLDQFYSGKGYCKPCATKRHRIYVKANPQRIQGHKLKAAYGLSLEEYEAMPQVCYICGIREARLVVDHSHHSKRVRGILCDHYNKGLGFFRDDPTLLYRAADYILGEAKPDIFDQTYEKVEDNG